jgi:FMN reductase
VSKKLNLTVVSGSVQRPSKTRSLLEAVVHQFQAVIPIEVHWVELGEIAAEVGVALRRSDLRPEIEAHFRAIETADLLIVGTPVYRASYTGLFKHLFDLVEMNALIDVPVLLTATGGSERHALIIEHELRPLFSFFQSLTLPIGVFGTDRDFTDYRISDNALKARVQLAVNRALPTLLQKQAYHAAAASTLTAAA